MLTNPTHTQKLKLALSISLASAMLVGCGSGGTQQTAPQDLPQNSVITGAAIKGAINEGLVRAYLIETQNGKELRASQPLAASTRTDINGEFSLDLGDDYSGQRVWVEVSADAATEMACDVTAGCGNGIDFGDWFKPGTGFSMAGLASIASSNSSVSISPLTDMALARTQASAGGLSAANFEAAKDYIENTFKLDAGALELVAADITRLSSAQNFTKSQLEHGIVSGALLALVNSPDWAGIDEVLDDVSQRLASGGAIANINAGNLPQVTLDDVFYQASEITAGIIEAGAVSNYSDSLVIIANETEQAYNEVSNPPVAIAPVQISTQPQGLSLEQGARASFSVVALGGGSLVYQWRLNGQVLSGANESTFEISSVSAADAGVYDVIVSNSVGSVRSLSALLNVSTPEIVAVEITEPPLAKTVTEGERAEFSVAATGGGTLSYQWRKNGQAIAGANGARLVITSAQLSDAASYDVVVTNSRGSEVSTAAQLLVNEAAPVIAPVQILTQPLSVAVEQGQVAQFSVGAQGGGELSFQWRLNGNVIAGANDSSLRISNAQQANAGVYDVVVSNSVGSRTSAAARLTVNAPQVAPVQIVAQPQGLSLEQGAQARFIVSAQGGGSLSYQWRVNGNAIAGANSASYTINNVQQGDAGMYDVVVSNSTGSQQSLAALLQVSAPAPVTKDVSLSWDIPSEREDGSALAMHEIKGYVIHYGNASGQLDQSLTVEGGGATTAEVEGLLAGTYYFAIATVDSDDVRGEFSAEISTTIQ